MVIWLFQRHVLLTLCTPPPDAATGSKGMLEPDVILPVANLTLTTSNMNKLSQRGRWPRSSRASQSPGLTHTRSLTHTRDEHEQARTGVLCRLDRSVYCILYNSVKGGRERLVSLPVSRMTYLTSAGGKHTQHHFPVRMATRRPCLAVFCMRGTQRPAFHFNIRPDHARPSNAPLHNNKELFALLCLRTFPGLFLSLDLFPFSLSISLLSCHFTGLGKLNFSSG